MSETLTQIREVAHALGLSLPDDRLPAIATAIEAAQQQIKRIRSTPTPVPTPTAFDASWSEKK